MLLISLTPLLELRLEVRGLAQWWLLGDILKLLEVGWRWGEKNRLAPLSFLLVMEK